MRNALSQRRATSLRNSVTDSEKALWRKLRKRQLCNLYFRRQMPIGPYIADFACSEISLIIEVDGGQHMDSKHDVLRDRFLSKEGFRVLRFWSNDVLTRIDAVMEEIYRAVRAAKMPPP